MRFTLIFLTLVFSITNFGCVPNYDYTFEKVTHSMGKKLDAKIWMFTGTKPPPLNLTDKNEFMNDVNVVLEKLGLPRIKQAVVEKSSITGFRTDRGIYEWNSYPLGTLKVVRHSGSYDSIWKVILED